MVFNLRVSGNSNGSNNNMNNENSHKESDISDAMTGLDEALLSASSNDESSSSRSDDDMTLAAMTKTQRSGGEVKVHAATNADDDDFDYKEFSLIPSSGVIPAQSELRVLLEFVPHHLKQYETSLVVDVEGVATDLLSVPISARSSVPHVELVESSIDLGRCFIFYSYERTLRLVNDTPLRARYSIQPEAPGDRFRIRSNQAEVDICSFLFSINLTH